MIVDLHLKGNLVIVIGGGKEGLKKIESLITQDCKILLFSEKTNPQISLYVKQKKIEFKKTKISNLEFLSKFKPILIMAATNDKKLNERIVKKAKKMRCYAYAVDYPEISDFAHPSIINIEYTIQVAVSTGGRSPVMAKKIKLEAEKIFKKIIKKQEIYEIKLQETMRKEAKEQIDSQSERRKYLYAVLNDPTIKQLIKDEKLKKAQDRAKRMLKDWK